MDKIKELIAKYPEVYSILAITLAGFLTFQTFYSCAYAGVALFGWVSFPYFKKYIKRANGSNE